MERFPGLHRRHWAAAAAALVLLSTSAGPDRADNPGVATISADALPTTTVRPRSTSVPTTTGTTTPVATSTSVGPPTGTTTTTVPVQPPTAPPQDVSRPIPVAPPTPPPSAPAPPWAWSITTTPAGYTSTDIGCATGTGAAALDAFFAQRMGPVMGADYQHVVPLGGGRYAWFFQDAFIDQTGGATRLDQSFFVHNMALLQDGACFKMLHRGTAGVPASFEQGTGENRATVWFWPMGAQTVGNRLTMFWAQMVKDPYEPGPGDGLGWHPNGMYLATYNARTLQRLSFAAAPNSGVSPLYGYAVADDGVNTYLFGNSFEQNLVREGGFFGGQHSGTAMYVARVPSGRLDLAPEYRTDTGWSPNPADARPFVRRYWAENPMQPRFMDGQWVSVAKVDGYWGDDVVVEVANHPWGPWTTTEYRRLSPRGNDPTMNTYHAHLLPWRAGNGSLLIAVSQNARRMGADAYPHPERYRLAVFSSGWFAAPPDPLPTTTTTPTTSTTSTTTSSTTTTSTTSTTSTTLPATTTTTSPTTTTTTAPTTTSSTTTTTTTTPGG